MRFLWFALLVMSFAVACSGGSAAPAATPTVLATSVQPAASPAGGQALGNQPTATTPPATATAPPTSTPEPTPTEAPEPTATTAPPPPTSPPPTSPPVPSGVAASIQGFGFPYRLTVPAGSTVIWTNLDPAPHDVTAKDDSWTSGLLAQGESYSRTFGAPGTFSYICKVHPYMTAVLIVN